MSTYKRANKSTLGKASVCCESGVCASCISFGKQVIACTAAPDIFLQQEVIYCAQVKGNKFSSDITLTFMQTWLCYTPVGEKG